MNNDYGYLDRGTLIQVGTLLKTPAGLGWVTAFKSQANNAFIVETSLREEDGWNGVGDFISYHKEDLEDMLRNGRNELKVYNES